MSENIHFVITTNETYQDHLTHIEWIDKTSEHDQLFETITKGELITITNNPLKSDSNSEHEQLFETIVKGEWSGMGHLKCIHFI